MQRNVQAAVLECSDELGKGVLVTTLEQALREHGELVKPYLGLKGTLPTYHKFAALNSAFWSGGLFIYVPANVNVAAPIVNLRWLEEQGAMLPRTLVVLERGASLTFMEGGLSTERQEQCLNCSVTDFFVQDGAQLNYLGLQQWSSNVWDISTTRTSLGRGQPSQRLQRIPRRRGDARAFRCAAGRSGLGGGTCRASISGPLASTSTSEPCKITRGTIAAATSCIKARCEIAPALPTKARCGVRPRGH